MFTSHYSENNSTFTDGDITAEGHQVFTMHAARASHTYERDTLGFVPFKMWKFPSCSSNYNARHKMF